MLLTERALLSILEHLPAGVIVADRDGRVVFENAAAMEILGHSVIPVTGTRTHRGLHGRTAEGVLLAASDYPLVRALRGERVPATEYRYVRPEGADVWLRAVAGPIMDGSRVAGASVLFRNIDAEKTAADKLRAAERRLDIAMGAGLLGAWTLDLATFDMTCTAGCKANFGRSADASFDYADLLDTVHPDDRERMQRTVEEALAARSEYVCEYRVVWPDGSVHWISARGRAEYDGEGVPRTMDGVTGEITERRFLEDTLRDQAEALRNADRQKDQFLAALSHELRNPLAAISYALQMLRLKGPEHEPTARAASVIERQVGQIQRMVDDLLEVSRISEGKVSLKLEPVDAAQCVAAAVETVRPQVDERRQRLHIDAPAGPLLVEGDLQRLTQVLVNLLNNASKYSDQGGEIRVALRGGDREAEIVVSDEGVGIPKDMQSRIFELFAQVDAHRARSEGGLGLGLALVKRLVQLHGGTVAVRSDGPGQGSEFAVRLPLITKRPKRAELKARPYSSRKGDAKAN
jgi:PAS domain S-box-containing protein